MSSLVHYDNEKDMQTMVDDTVEFIMAETSRIIKEQFDEPRQKDGNTYILVSQNLALSLMLRIQLEVRLRQEKVMASISRPNGQDENRLPINGPDFFNNYRRPP